jgi:cell division protein FtsI/penicillin-binding protein 2
VADEFRTGDRSPRAGAHRAPRAAPPVRGSRAGKATDGDGRTGVFGVGFLSRSMLARAAALVVLATIVGAGIVHGGASSAEPTVYQFLLAWEQGQYQQAAALTTGPPKEVAADLKGFYQQLDATSLVLSMAGISQQGRTATAEFTARIGLGSSGQEWTPSGTSFNLLETGSTWRIVWSPSVIVPQLQAGDRLAVAQEVPKRGQLLSASGQPLGVPSTVVEIGVYPDRLTGAPEVQQIATRLATVFHLQVSQVAGEIEASPSKQFRELITLTPRQYDKVRASLAGTPGLQVRSVTQSLFDSIAPDVVGAVGAETASILRQNGVPYQPGSTVGLSGLQQSFQRQLAGTPTTGVLLQNAKGRAIAFLPGSMRLGIPAKAVYTTLDYGVQMAANNALAHLGSAAIVAVQADTGKILAVASHHVAGMPALDPLAGQYQPGQAFTIVSAAAILASGHASPGSPEQCMSSYPVNGVPFTNIPAEPAGLAATSTTVRKDFAVGCSTAFASLSQLLSPGDMTYAAAEFGIGAPWHLPLPQMSYYSGTVGQPGGPDEIAADAIGRGEVRVSPLSMALAAGVAASGRWHAPSLVTTGSDQSVTAKVAMSAQVRLELQGLMREAVAHGSAAAADNSHSVYGQAGSARFAKHGPWISWFVGYQGNIAFAVAELVPSPSDSVAALAGSFLRNIQSGS